ncbi:phage late control D family protein [Paenibacillus sp. MER 99-2]|uniref:phage late control D family protein n=1 Tax=Paenibacillus sp. MER 99-2 TaxID=2939572 RepID=UPI00203DC6B2|nr:phage late control D family protein [Paenibacillus sp. MER 99-2]MCM3172047.1 phage late control D family protein [Paenibacillus sp. MER 99-2]
MEVTYQGDGYELTWPYNIKELRSFRIERAFNTHAKCVFIARMSEEEAEQCLIHSSFEDSLIIQKIKDARPESWFAGGIIKVDIQMEDGIPLVEVHALSRSYVMDMTPQSRSYQNKRLTYTDAVRQLAGKYHGGDAQNMATSDQASIGALLVQYEETDWQFMKRLAARVGTVILPDVTMDAPRIFFGVPDLSWGQEIKAIRYTAMKDRAQYEQLKAHAEGDDAKKVTESDFVRYRVTSEQFCQVGDDVSFKEQIWVVSESVISYNAGRVRYEYLFVQRRSLRRKSRRNEQLQGRSLEGRVVKRANNMVKVHLDIDDQHDEQGNWWFPYSGEGNNIFHCLPDEGARIKVYFPSGTEKQSMAINSVRGGSEDMKSRTVFHKPATKVFEMPGEARMQLGDDGVLFKKGSVSLHLDAGNISLNATEDLFVVASSQIEAGSGSDKGMLESFKIQAEQQIVLQTNVDQYVVLSGNRVGIQSKKVDFQKIEVDFAEMLTDEELEELYLDMLADGEIMKQEIDLSMNLKTAVQLTDAQRADIRSQVAQTAQSDPGLANQAKDWMSSKTPDEQKTVYQKKYVNQPAAEPEKKSKEQKQVELAQQQQEYKEMNQNRTKIYNWQQQSKEIRATGERAGKTEAQIQAMLPAPPVLSGQRSSGQGSSSGKKSLGEQFMESTGLGDAFKSIRPWLDQMELEHVIPQKPDYLSKQTQKTVYLSRYTFQVLIVDPQMMIAQFNIIFGVVAIISAIPSGGLSLYVLAAADAAIGATMIVVNVQKLNDLKNGNAYTNPKFLGMDQKMLDDLGVALMFVNLAILAKHGLNKAADKLINSKNMSALDSNWTAWKQQAKTNLNKTAGNITDYASDTLNRLSNPKLAMDSPSPGSISKPTKPLPQNSRQQNFWKETEAGKGDLARKLDGGAGNSQGINYLTDPVEMKLYIIPPIDGFDAFLERKYIEIRKIGLEDVSVVAKNTGLSEQDIINMKKHLFLDRHQLSIDGAPYKELYFKADQDAAYAWQLAQKRELTAKEKEWFKQLAYHELKEKELMDSGIPLMDRSTWNGNTFNKDPEKNAHDKANLTDPNPRSFPDYDSYKDWDTYSDDSIHNY